MGKSSVPADYQLPVPRPGFRLTRKMVLRDVDTSMPVTPQNPIIRWKIPSASAVILDFRRAAVYISLSCAVTAPWSVRPSNLAWNLIHRLSLDQGGQYVEDRRYFGFQETIIYQMQMHKRQQETTGEELWGAGSQVVRNAKSASWVYCLPFPTTSLTKTILPWFCLTKTGDGRVSTTALPDMTLQWELAQPNNFLEVYGGTGVVNGLTWTVTRVQVEYEELYVDGGPGGLLSVWHTFPTPYPKIFYRSLFTQVYPVTTSTEQVILIDMKYQSVISIFGTLQYTLNLSNPQIMDKFETYVGPAAGIPLVSYQWEVNSQLWPDKEIGLYDPAYTMAYKKYQETFNMYHARGVHEEVTNIGSAAFANDKFVFVFDGNEHPFSTNTLNPVATAFSNSQIQLKLKFSAAPPTGLQIMIHMFHWRCWNFGAKGSVPVIEV
jgi:hypothetical protein